MSGTQLQQSPATAGAIWCRVSFKCWEAVDVAEPADHFIGIAQLHVCSYPVLRLSVQDNNLRNLPERRLHVRL